METEQLILDLTEQQETEEIIPGNNISNNNDLLNMDFSAYSLDLGF